MFGHLGFPKAVPCGTFPLFRIAARLDGVSAYTITVRARYPNEPGMLGAIASAIGEAGGDIGGIDIVQARGGAMIRDFTIGIRSEDHADAVVLAIKKMRGVRVRSVSDAVLRAHLGGKIEMRGKVDINTRADLSVVYTPGVARVCRSIADDPASVWNLTTKRNAIAIVTDGTAVLGLGDIGPEAALPVMEGKAMLFKEFGGVDAWPICLDTTDPDEIVRTVAAIAPSFGGINLEDIAAPRCFEVESRLREILDIPVFHDDQDGTAVVVLAALQNALKIVGKAMGDVRLVVSGCGAAGIACTRMLLDHGIGDVVAVDREGIVYQGRRAHMNGAKKWLAAHTNRRRIKGSLADAMKGADIFLGVSAPNVITTTDIQAMNRDPIVFALANPDPEINPEAVAPYARVIATGRSDYPNQINNVLCFPGMFRGALDVQAREINTEMKAAAAQAIAGTVKRNELSEEYIVPSVFNRGMARDVARAVAQAAQKSGVARSKRSVRGVAAHSR
jgi:malate dehydrogenase (oxaloacetate-decarboxylating)